MRPTTAEPPVRPDQSILFQPTAGADSAPCVGPAKPLPRDLHHPGGGIALSSTAVARFWSKVDKSPGFGPNGDCWRWTAAQWNGYGAFDRTRAHRVSYALAHGAIPTGLWVLHRCDNRLCVNPNHLRPGTYAENIADMVARGRSQRGEHHCRAKLTEAQVLEIRRSPERHSVLARKLGVDEDTVASVRKRRTWHWLKEVGA